MDTPTTQRKTLPVVILLSSADFIDPAAIAGGVSALSFIQTYVTLTSSNIAAVVVTPDGSSPSFVREDDKCEQWLRTSAHVFTTPKSIDDIDVREYSGLCIPHCPGGFQDFIHPNSKCARLVETFATEKKPICIVGFGITALFGTKRGADGKWIFAGRHFTTVSNLELCRFPYFAKLGIVPEDFLRDNGALYSGGQPDQLHLVIDGRIVTAQNVQTTTLAVQNIIWLCKYDK